MRTAELYWLAGILDGEGCFGSLRRSNGKPGGHPSITLQMTDEDIVARVGRMFGVRPMPRHSKRELRASWVVRVTCAKAAAIMMTIYPVMGKRRQAKIAEILSLWRMIPPSWKRPGNRVPWAERGRARRSP